MHLPIINDARNPSKLCAVSTSDAHAWTIQDSTKSPSAKNHEKRWIIVKIAVIMKKETVMC